MSAYTVPTQTPEADGTLAWNETTLVLVRTFACSASGYGYSFADIATAHLIDAHLKHVVVAAIPLMSPTSGRPWREPFAISVGRGLCSMAISAIDNALWDLKARLLHLSVADLLGRAPGLVYAIPEAHGAQLTSVFSIAALSSGLPFDSAVLLPGMKTILI